MAASQPTLFTRQYFPSVPTVDAGWRHGSWLVDKFQCSIGTEHLSRAAGRSIRVNLPKNEVCVAN